MEENISYSQNIIENMKLEAYMHDRIIYLEGTIDSNSSLMTNRMFYNLKKSDTVFGEKRPISVYIDSLGGSVHSALSIISTIESMKQDGYIIDTYAFSECMSAAVNIFICGSTRYAQKYTRFMIHLPSLYTESGSLSSLDKTRKVTEDLDDLWNKMTELMKKHSKIPQSVLDEVTKHDVEKLFWTDEAVTFGMVDKIL